MKFFFGGIGAIILGIALGLFLATRVVGISVGSLWASFKGRYLTA